MTEKKKKKKKMFLPGSWGIYIPTHRYIDIISYIIYIPIYYTYTGRPGSPEVPRNPLDTLGREFDPGKRDFSHKKTKCPTGGERLNR